MKTLATILLFLTAGISPGLAGVTGWTEIQGGAVRLLSAGQMENGSYRLGLEFSLEPGWHTYWRYPGEAGIPPLVSLENAGNVKSFEVRYPAPERYDDGFSQSIVYHNGIVLPIDAVPEDARKSGVFSIRVLFGICREICVPGEALLEMPFGPDENTDALAAKLIDRDLAAVPKPSGDNAPRITNVTSDDGYLLIDAETTVPGGADLFAEGPEGSFIGLPKPVGASSNSASWRLSKKGLQVSGADDILRLVLVDPAGAVYHLEPLAGLSLD